MNTSPVVLVIENAMGVTGSLHSILRSCTALKAGFNFEFLLPRNSNARSLIESEGFVVHELPMREIRKHVLSLLLYLPSLLLNAFRLHSLIGRRRVALVVNNDFYNLMPVLTCAWTRRVAYVTYVRFMPSKLPRLLVQIWFGLHRKFALKVIAVSEAVRQELPPSEKVVVVHNELPLEEVPYQHTESTLILYPANFIKGKGQDAALVAFASLSQKFDSWRLRFVGGDLGLEKNRAFRSSLIKASRALRCEHQIEWFDLALDLSGHYHDAAFILNFSESESFSLTTLEAQFYGRPVVVTRCGGPEEIVEHQKTGLLVPVGNTNAMTEAMTTLIEGADLRTKMGLAAYVHVREKFSQQNTIDKLADIYRQALKT